MRLYCNNTTTLPSHYQANLHLLEPEIVNMAIILANSYGCVLTCADRVISNLANYNFKSPPPKRLHWVV